VRGPRIAPHFFHCIVTAQFMSAKGLNFRFGCALPTSDDWGEALHAPQQTASRPQSHKTIVKIAEPSPKKRKRLAHPGSFAAMALTRYPSV
jgi:hypothetical protein